MTDFAPFPKIARLRRTWVVTEKIDGTNAAVVVSQGGWADKDPTAICNAETDEGWFTVHAQSRTRFITPEQDNYGFASWVERHAPELVRTLGVGVHFGEWWGQGIQRGYGLNHKRFSLFNVKRWQSTDVGVVPGLGVVPCLTSDTNVETAVRYGLDRLRRDGSVAAQAGPHKNPHRFDNPEGVVAYSTANGTLFKVLAKHDELPKSAAPEQEAADSAGVTTRAERELAK